jgi:MFS family permease
VLGSVGVGLCLVVAAAGWFFRDPPQDWWPAHVDPLGTVRDARIRRTPVQNPPFVRRYAPGGAVRAPVLWTMWLCLLCTAGIDVFGTAFQVPFGRDMGFTGAVVATAMSLKAVADGTGRGVIGRLSGRHSRRGTLIIVCAVLGAAQFGVLVSGRSGSVRFFLLFAMISGFAGGAVFPLVAAMAAEWSGTNRAAARGTLHSSTLVSGLIGSGLGAVFVGEWNYHAAFVLAGSIGLASAVLALFLKAPGRPNVRRIVPNPHPLGEEMA